MNLLETIQPIARVRRHHAIEHATVTLLTERNPDVRVIGRSDTKGFYIYGDVDRDELEDAAQRGLARLQSGESALAVHPRCGTNIVVTSLLSALAAMLALGRRPRLDKIPNVILATTLAAFLAQPLGAQVQEHITTSPDVRGARIGAIRESRMGKVKVQHVEIEWE